MSSTRVVLITASGPNGQVDIGVRSDATPKDLVGSLGSVIGVGSGTSVVEHHAPPRPGAPQGTRAQLTGDASLGDSGVADGDMIIFRKASEQRTAAPGQRLWGTPADAAPPLPASRPPGSRSPGAGASGSRPPGAGPSGIGPSGVGPPSFLPGADATRPDPGYRAWPDAPGARPDGGGRPPERGGDRSSMTPAPGDSGIAPGDAPRRPISRMDDTVQRLSPPQGGSPGRRRPPSGGGAPGPAQPSRPWGEPPGPGASPGYWSWSESADSGPDNTGQWTWSESADAAHTDPTMPELPKDPRHSGPGRADVTRPARREPGAHRAEGPGSGRSHRSGSTRGTDSDEPDDRH